MSDPMSDAAAGMEVARLTLLAMANEIDRPDRGDAAALRELNQVGSAAEAAWAAAYFLGALRNVIADQVHDNPHLIARKLRAGAEFMPIDALITEIDLIALQIGDLDV